jgi:Lrp/AsnC family leucine-responsive transcriptional regulator
MTSLDPLDRRALVCLLADGRLSWAELGQSLGLSPPAVAERVRRLRTEGVIDGFTVRVRPERVGLPLTVLIAVRLERHEDRGAFLRFVAECAEITECHHVTGEDDYALKVRCSGVPRLEELLATELRGALSGIRTRTTLVLSTVKDTPALPLAPPEEKPARRSRRKPT